MAINLQEKIKELAYQKRITIDKVAEILGMSRGNYYLCMKRNSMELKYLQKLSDYFNVSMSDFFENTPEAQEKRAYELEKMNSSQFHEEEAVKYGNKKQELVNKYQNEGYSSEVISMAKDLEIEQLRNQVYKQNLEKALLMQQINDLKHEIEELKNKV